MFRTLLTVLSMLVPAVSAQQAVAQNADRLTVVELFTSQGCSSCPPADAVLKSLRDRPGILPLSWPVDYWDRLGWEDTFAHPHNAMRQAAYNKRLGRGGVFTPQMIFDGRIQSVGSKQQDVRKAVDSARAETRLLVTPEVSVENGTVTVTLPETELSGIVSVSSVWYLGDAIVKIGDGENRGRTLHYTNVVRGSDMLADWNGETRTLTFEVSQGQTIGADHFALLLHEGYPYGPIVGAASVAVPSATSGR